MKYKFISTGLGQNILVVYSGEKCSLVELLDDIDEVTRSEFSRMLLLHLNQHLLIELFKSVVSVLGAGNDFLEQVFTEEVLAGLSFTLVEELERLHVDVLNLCVDVILQRVGSQEVVQDVETVSADLWVTDGYEEVVLQLGKDLQPALLNH